MVDLNWPPPVVAAMTISQLECLASESPPGARGKIGSYEEMQVELERIEAEARAWSGG